MSWDKEEHQDEPLRMGLSRLDPGYALGYRWRGGPLLGWPMWIKRLIVRLWNPINCRIWGHYWFGPIDDDGVHIERHCVNCGKRS